MKINNVGDGKVHLIAGGGKVYADIAAKFVRIEKPVLEIVDSPKNLGLIKNLLDSGHLSALEFDNFIFGVEGYSRVTETQLVRKRMASYLIKSGRAELDGRRAYSMVLPKEVAGYVHHFPGGERMSVQKWVEMGEILYDSMIDQGIKEEDARYIKPQATEFKAIIAMNAHALLDWFKIRCCMNAQAEIRDLANKMRKLCLSAAPELFENSGPSCKVLGYCPENKRQHPVCKKSGAYLPKDEALSILSTYKK